MNLMETTLLSEMTKDMVDSGISWQAPYSISMLKTLFSALSTHLGKIKADDDGKPHAIIFRDANYLDYKEEEAKDKPILFSAICTKEKHDDGDSYSLMFTFDESEIPEDAVRIDFTDKNLEAYVVSVAAFEYGISFRPALGGMRTMQHIFATILRSIKKWFNVNISSITEVEMKDFFTLQASLVNDKVDITIIPSEAIRQNIKDDSNSEKKDDKK